MPFITAHLPVLNRLGFPWRWVVAEGAAMNVADTKWCRPQSPRLSNDGTTKYLDSLSGHPRVTVIAKPKWEGKVAMVNACLDQLKEPCILLQMDSDECWSAEQLTALVGFFRANSTMNSARFFCRYFIGANIEITSKNGYGNRPEEWIRAWRWKPGMKFLRHEPPDLPDTKPCATREHTSSVGLIFDHYAYATESQVRYKEQFYGYADAVLQWNRLQQNKTWPVPELNRFLPWVGVGVTANLVYQ